MRLPPAANAHPSPMHATSPAAGRRAEEAKKRSAGRTKNLGLLSFGEEAEEEEAQLAAAAAKQPAAAKLRSAHDVLQDDR